MSDCAKHFCSEIYLNFSTETWKKFATSGIKAWYAHTRGWLCSKIEHITLIHYENVLKNFKDGKYLVY